MKIAVIILNYNSSEDCRKCVADLKRQVGVETELILVDNCSPDADKVEALCREQGCTFIASRENRGYNAGNNIGLRYAADKGYKYALIANPDMEFPQTDYIMKLASIMENNSDIVVAGSDIVGPSGIHQNPFKQRNNWISNFSWIVEVFTREKKDSWKNVDKYDVSHFCWELSGCCILIRMKFIETINFFDEYPFLYCEESILAEQVYSAQKRMYYFASRYAIHRHIDSTKGSQLKRIDQWKRSRLYFINKYSRDSFLGKYIAKCSVYIYVVLLKGIKKYVKKP